MPASIVAVSADAIPAGCASTPAGERLVSLDAYRGLTMFAMSSDAIGLGAVAAKFPNSPWWQAIGYQVDHVPWVGCAVWDLIQPLVHVHRGRGDGLFLHQPARRGQSWGRLALHAAGRSVTLILLGLFVRSSGEPQTNFVFSDVLSQIGLGYFFLFLLWDQKPAVQLGAALAILAADWLLFYLWPLPPDGFDLSSVNLPADWPHLSGIAAHWDMNTNAAAAIDRWFLNLFPRAEPFVSNPGGYQTLNFVPALSTMIFGLLAGGLLKGNKQPWRKVGGLILAGMVGIALGWGLDHWGLCPLVKRIWTPSWTLFSTGIVLVTLGLLYAVVDVLRFRRWTFPFIVVGMNSILIYVMAEILKPWIAASLAHAFRFWLERLHPLESRAADLRAAGPRLAHAAGDVADLLLVLPAEDLHPDLRRPAPIP